MASHDPDEKRQVDFAQIVKNMRDNMIAVLEYEEVRAKLARKRFLELQKEGFTEAQAIDIVKGSY